MDFNPDNVTKLLRFETDNPDIPRAMTPEEFMRNSYKMTDREINDFLYAQAKTLASNGMMPPWPEDDYGIVMWFVMSFITPEMRQVFPDIAKEYLANEPLIGTEFSSVPYPRLGEENWDDALYFRLLAIMIIAARKGSRYSKNFLIALYKVYYRHEYNRIKNLKKLTFMDVLQALDDDCKRKGLPSGHSTQSGVSFNDFVMNKRKHEAGWMSITKKDKTSASPVTPPKHTGDSRFQEVDDLLEKSAKFIRSMTEAPVEPPLQPVSSRLFIVCELLGIPIDVTCNSNAVETNETVTSMLNLSFLSSPEYREITASVLDRFKEYTLATYPEAADPYQYQTNENYIALEVAQKIMEASFGESDSNDRMPYSSHRFDLAALMSKVSFWVLTFYPEIQFSFNDVMFLCMILYLSECMCDLMRERDKELDILLRFQGRKHQGEYVEENKPLDEQGERLLKTVGGLKEPQEQKKVEPTPAPVENTPPDIDSLVEQLAEKEALLAETQQKLIRQRHLYEEERKRAADMENRQSTADAEHAELIALREYVYSLRDEEDIQIDDATRDQLVADLQEKNVAILGGHANWVKKMKRLFPKWKFIPVDDESQRGMKALESASFIYIYTGALQHKVYYRAMNIIQSSGKMHFYLGGTNITENIVRIHKDLCR